MQVILEEGYMVPADVRLICSYDDPTGFEKYQELQDSTAHDTEEKDMPESGDEDDHGHNSARAISIVAVDQSAITGESLAVSRCSY